MYGYQINAKEKMISHVTIQAHGSLQSPQRIESSCKIGQLVLDTPYNLFLSRQVSPKEAESTDDCHLSLCRWWYGILGQYHFEVNTKMIFRKR